MKIFIKFKKRINNVSNVKFLQNITKIIRTIIQNQLKIILKNEYY